MEINHQKLEQDLIRETEVKLDNKVNNEEANIAEKDLLEKERVHNCMNDEGCKCSNSCDCHEKCDCDNNCDCDENCKCDENSDCKNCRIDQDLLDEEEKEYKEGGKSENNEFDREGVLEKQIVTEVMEEGKYPESTLENSKDSDTVYESDRDVEIIEENELDENVKDEDSYPFAPSDEYDTSDLFPYSEENILIDEYKIKKENIEEIERSHPEDTL